VLSHVLDHTKELVRKDFDWFEKVWNDFGGERHKKHERLLAKLDDFAEKEIDEAIHARTEEGRHPKSSSPQHQPPPWLMG
jgi:hypothetical protein